MKKEEAKKEVKKEEKKLTAEQSKALDLVKATIEKKYGKRSILTYEGPEEKFEGPCLGTGILSLDRALGKPIPGGRIIEIYGPESNGKTTLTLQILGSALKNIPNKRTAYVDAEHSLDTAYAARLMRTNDFEYNQPATAEEALDVTDMLVRSGVYSAVAIDSVAALVPNAELEGEMGDSHMGLQARLMSQALRKLTGIAHETGTTIIFLNQIRMKIGVLFGNPETTAGGNALKFYASQRLELRRTGFLKETTEGSQPFGITTKIKVVKNKVAPPMREVELGLIFGEGFSANRDLIDVATGLGIVEKAGSWLSYKGEKLGQGLDNALTLLKDHPKMAEEIDAACRKVIGI